MKAGLPEKSVRVHAVQAVIFDLFGTLIESLHRAEFEKTLSEMAAVLSVPEEDFVRSWNNTWEKQRIGFFPTVEADIENICRITNTQPENSLLYRAAEMARAFARQLLLKPRNDAVRTLTRLKETGYKTGLISNCARNIPTVWKDTPLAPLVDAPIFSCSVGLRKPDLQIYHSACHQLESPPQKCLYVADGSERELTGASQAGLYPILFHGPDEDPYDEGLDRREWRGPTVFQLEDVLKFLDSGDK